MASVSVSFSWTEQHSGPNPCNNKLNACVNAARYLKFSMNPAGDFERVLQSSRIRVWSIMYAFGSAHIPDGICFVGKILSIYPKGSIILSLRAIHGWSSPYLASFLEFVMRIHPLPVLFLVQVAWKTGPGATGDCPSE